MAVTEHNPAAGYGHSRVSEARGARRLGLAGGGRVSVDVWRVPRGKVQPAELRAILAAHAGCSPEAVVVERAPRGKPYLAAPDAGLHFNVSDTAGLALVAVTRAGRIGVDVEVVRERPRWPRIAAARFSAREAAAIDSLEAFLRAWVRKEAVVKLTGEGLRQLGDVEVTVSGPPAVIGAPQWQLRDVEVPEGWLAAVAVEGEAGAVTVRDLA